MEEQVKKWEMELGLKSILLKLPTGAKQCWTRDGFGSRKPENTPYFRFTSLPLPPKCVRSFLCACKGTVRPTVEPGVTWEAKTWGCGQDDLDSVSIPVTQHPLLRVHVCFSLQCRVQRESWKSQGMLEIKQDKGRRVCGNFITRNSLNVAYPPGGKIEYFFAQSISSITDTLPNYGPFVYIEIKIRTLKKKPFLQFRIQIYITHLECNLKLHGTRDSIQNTNAT